MTSSLTITFSGTSSVLQTYFLPEITFDADCEYSCALLDLIIKKNNDKTNLSDIVKLSVVHIDCDIISGSYINGKRNHTIHQFATSASLVKGQTFVEIPRHLNYFPVKTKNLYSIQIAIVDQQGNVANITGCDIICRIKIKRDTSQQNPLKHVNIQQERHLFE